VSETADGGDRLDRTGPACDRCDLRLAAATIDGEDLCGACALEAQPEGSA
jgi:hypothetical protein